MTLILISCSSSTKVEKYWEEPEFEKGQFDKILVVGFHPKTWGRKAFEFTMKEELQKLGLTALASIEVFGEGEEISEETFRKHFTSEDIDAIIVSRLISAEEKQKNVYNYSGYAIPYAGFYGGFYGYYFSTYSIVYSPGYSIKETQINIETNVYETKNSKLIWGGISETFDPKDALDLIRQSSKSIVRELDYDGLFKKNQG